MFSAALGKVRCAIGELMFMGSQDEFDQSSSRVVRGSTDVIASPLTLAAQFLRWQGLRDRREGFRPDRASQNRHLCIRRRLVVNGATRRSDE